MSPDAILPADDRLIVGLDITGRAEAEALVDALGDTVSFYKIGYQLGYSGGLPLAAELVRMGKKVFLDLKLHDIANTVEKGVANIAAMGVTMTTVHAYPQVMRAAAAGASGSPLCVLGVTVMTSLGQDDLREAGIEMSVEELVMRRAGQARDAGLGGIVASAAEATSLRKLIGPDMAVVTPGIRPAGADAGDQKRVVTPADALRAGASHLVVARPIIAAPDPRAAAQAILSEITGI